MTESTRVVPVPDADSRPFWAACQERRLIAQRCTACGRFRWPPVGVCPACHGWQAEWRDLDGTGSVASFVVAHRAFDPAFTSQVPYVIVQVTLNGTDDAVIIDSNLEGIDWDQVRVGLPVRVTFDTSSPAVTLPKFRPA